MRAISELYTHRLLLNFFYCCFYPILLCQMHDLNARYAFFDARNVRWHFSSECVCAWIVLFMRQSTQTYTHSMILIVVLMFHIRIHIFTNPWLFGMFEHVLCTYVRERARSLYATVLHAVIAHSTHTHIPSHINFLDFLLRRLVAGDWASKPLMNEWTNTHARMSLNIPSSVYAHTHTLTHTCRTKWMFLC